MKTFSMLAASFLAAGCLRNVPIDSCGDVDAKPVVHFRFDQCGETTPEAMGTALDATLVEGYCVDEGWLGSALECPIVFGMDPDGSGSSGVICARADDDPLFEPKAFTISAWVYGRDWNGCGGGHCTIVSKGNTDAGLGYWLAVLPTGLGPGYGPPGPPLARLVLADGRGGEIDIWGPMLEARTWHHVVATYDGSTATVWVDGTPGQSQQIPFQVAYGAEDFLIGSIVNRDFLHNGLIDELKLWDFAMSDEEVADLNAAYDGCE